MTWNIVTHHEEAFVEVITSGLADAEGSLAMARALAQQMQASRVTSALVDHSSIDAVAGTTIQIYERPSSLRALSDGVGIRIAEVVRPEHREHFRFLETVCVNQGWRFAVFEARDEAMAWLRG
jgi:hypothetical protein